MSRSRRSLALVLLLAIAPAADARKVKRRTPVVVRVEPDDDGDTLKERVREAKGRPVRPVLHTSPLHGPAPLVVPAPAAPPVTGNAYRPVDVLATNPSYDGFPASSHVEPSIAAAGSSVVTVFNDGGADFSSPNPATITNADGFSISTDGGRTFRDQGKRPTASGYTSYNGDNVAATGPDGDLYYLSDSGRGASFNAMAVSRSTDGGRTWPTTGNASTGRSPKGFFDKGWIAVDVSPTATRGNVYVTWSDFQFGTGQNRTDLYFSRSTDRGLSWSSQLLDTFPHPIAVTYVQTAANGWVYVGEQDEGTIVNGVFTGTNYVRVSTDGGKTFGPLRSAGAYRAVGDERAIALCGDPSFFGGLVRYLKGPIEADSSLRIAVDPTDPSGKTVFVTTQSTPEDKPGDRSDVYVWTSTDGGASFAPPVRVNDDRTTTDQFMPDLWVAPDGTLGVLWLDRRNDTATNWRTEAWMALSRNKGKTWSCSFPVSSQAFPVVGRCQMSDYNGIYADRDRFYLAWGDGRQVDQQGQTTSAIYGATLPLGGPGPLLSLVSVEPAANGLFRVRLRNDGLADATGLKASITVDGNKILSFAPTAQVPFPDLPGCHGEDEQAIPALYAVEGPVVTGTVQVNGPLGNVGFPFTFANPAPPDAPRPGLVSRTDFEGTVADWTPAPGSLWHVTSGCAAEDPGHSGSKVAYFGLDPSCTYNLISGNSYARVFGSLTSRPFALAPGAVRLRYNEWTGLPGIWTSAYAGLQISTDGGLSFEALRGYGRMSRVVPDPSLPLMENGSPIWRPVDLDLSEYAGKQVVLRFFFNAVGASTNLNRGYAVDDLELVQVSLATNGTAATCAAPQPIESGALTLSNEASRPAASDTLPPCAGSGPAPHPLWFQWVPSISGTYELSVPCGGSGAAETSLSVWTGSPCAGSPVAPGVLACAVSTCATSGTPARVTVRAEAGVALPVLVTSAGGGNVTLAVEPRTAGRMVPIVLDVVSSRGAYRTEVTLTNRGGTTAAVSLTYTASLGTGSGTVTDTLAAGRQLVLADVLAWLRTKGLSIPDGSTAPQAGTLVVTFDGAADGDVSATARTLSPTAAPLPVGLASLAYPGLAPAEPGASSATLFGLRSTDADRSKVALVSTGTTPVTLRVTVVADGRRVVIRDGVTLPARGWLQIEDPLGEAGAAAGWAVVERTSTTGTFTAYGIVNDNRTNDGSYLEPLRGVFTGSVLTVPVLVETSRFRSELVLANRGSAEARLTLRYRESLGPAAGGSMTLTLKPGSQWIVPDAIDFLRKGGLALGTAGDADRAGALRVEVSGVALSDVFAAARTAAPVADGGQLGLFTGPVYGGQEAVKGAVIDGLQTSADVRSNVAVVNAGGDGDTSVTLRLQVYDGATGTARGAPLDVTLSPGEWAQPASFFGSSGAAQGWVTVTRLSGSAPWIAYGVVNDGGVAGQRTDDGAYIPMRRLP